MIPPLSAAGTSALGRRRRPAPSARGGGRAVACCERPRRRSELAAGAGKEGEREGIGCRRGQGGREGMYRGGTGQAQKERMGEGGSQGRAGMNFGLNQHGACCRGWGRGWKMRIKAS
eukprot:7370336-Pyramimonas_sp.AAC.1